MRKLLIASSVIFAAFAASVHADTEVDQANTKFAVDSATVKVGENINFVNKDTVTHNIKVLNGDDVQDKGLQKPGETTTVKFDKAGTYEVRCNIHPKMKMTVTAQ